MLPLSSGAFQSPEELFGAFSNSAPDRWGRILIDRRARQLAREGGTAKRQVNEFDYLLGANDATRQGAIRFRRQGDEGFLNESNHAIPKVTSLPELLDAAIAERADIQTPERRLEPVGGRHILLLRRSTESTALDWDT